MSESSCSINGQPAILISICLYSADRYLLVFSEGNCTQQSKGFDYCPVHATGACNGFYESGLLSYVAYNSARSTSASVLFSLSSLNLEPIPVNTLRKEGKHPLTGCQAIIDPTQIHTYGWLSRSTWFVCLWNVGGKWEEIPQKCYNKTAKYCQSRLNISPIRSFFWLNQMQFLLFPRALRTHSENICLSWLADWKSIQLYREMCVFLFSVLCQMWPRSTVGRAYSWDQPPRESSSWCANFTALKQAEELSNCGFDLISVFNSISKLSSEMSPWIWWIAGSWLNYRLTLQTMFLSQTAMPSSSSASRQLTRCRATSISLTPALPSAPRCHRLL